MANKRKLEYDNNEQIGKRAKFETTQSLLTNLPSNVFEDLAKYLQLDTIKALRLVNKQTLRMVDECTSIWKKKICFAIDIKKKLDIEQVKHLINKFYNRIYTINLQCNKKYLMDNYNFKLNNLHASSTINTTARTDVILSINNYEMVTLANLFTNSCESLTIHYMDEQREPSIEHKRIRLDLPNLRRLVITKDCCDDSVVADLFYEILGLVTIPCYVNDAGISFARLLILNSGINMLNIKELIVEDFNGSFKVLQKCIEGLNLDYFKLDRCLSNDDTDYQNWPQIQRIRARKIYLNCSLSMMFFILVNCIDLESIEELILRDIDDEKVKKCPNESDNDDRFIPENNDLKIKFYENLSYKLRNLRKFETSHSSIYFLKTEFKFSRCLKDLHLNSRFDYVEDLIEFVNNFLCNFKEIENLSFKIGLVCPIIDYDEDYEDNCYDHYYKEVFDLLKILKQSFPKFKSINLNISCLECKWLMGLLTKCKFLNKVKFTPDNIDKFNAKMMISPWHRVTKKV